MAGTAPPRLTIAFASYGLRIGVEFFDDAIRDSVLERLPPGWARCALDDSATDRRYRLDDAGAGESLRYRFFVDGDVEPEGQSTTLEGMLDNLEGDIQIHVAEFAIPHIFVHAGVVGWQGRAIVLPGSSFAGKSTLVTSLVNAGATYYSDEYAVFDADGRVLPYPRRVSLRQGPHGGPGRVDFSHRAPRGEAALQPLPVGLVALMKYQPESGWRVDPLPHGPAILAMCEHTVAIQRRPADAMGILSKVADTARVVQGSRGDVDDAVVRLIALAESDH